MAIQLHPMRREFDAVALLVGRICFASDFLLFGSRKFANPSIIYNLIEARHLLGELVYPTIVLQLGCGLLVLLGYQTRLAAVILRTRASRASEPGPNRHSSIGPPAAA